MGTGGAMPAGSGRSLRLDPLALPVRFRTADAAADERVRLVELDRDRVTLLRSVRGVRMKVSVPVSAFLGVAMRMLPPGAADAPAASVAVTLEHRDPGLTVPLFAAPDATDLIAEWRLWARIFGMPLLVAGEDGKLHEPFARLGAIHIAPARGRARRRGTVSKRRPRILLRRKPGRPRTAVIHREREIIARS
jgi:hypothetical protein